MSDRPYRICFPPPVILHGNDKRDLVERVLEYLRQPDKLRIEPLGPEPIKEP